MSTAAEDPGPQAQDGAGAGLIAFLSWTITKNELVEATASALRTGCQKVLSVEDDPNSVDLRTADLDGIVNRFKNKHRLDMKDRTREQYEQRFRQSVDMYLKWLANDPAWKPTQRKRAVVASNGAASKAPRVASGSEVPRSARDVEQHQSGMITYPFPIRPGLQGKISLPEDLTMREARRIAAFVSTLAFEDEPEPPRALLTGPFVDDE